MNKLLAVMAGLVSALIAAGSSQRALADSQATGCGARLTVELTPDVPDVSDPGFLSSLLGNHPAYRLYLLKRDDLTGIELELTGPGPTYRCQRVIETMRKDARVLSIRADFHR